MRTRGTRARWPVRRSRRSPRPASKVPSTTDEGVAPSSTPRPSRHASARRRGRRALRLLGLAAVVAIVLGAAGFLAYVQPQPLLPEGTAALVSDAEVVVSRSEGDITFRPSAADPTVGLILYPGGKVPPAAYAPAARRIAAMSGVLVTLVDVPFNLAVFAIDAADGVIAREPGVTTWVVGGHSLGGSMAAQYAASHPGAVRGLVLWASYSAADLSAASIDVLSVSGSLDGATAAIRSAANVGRLPSDTTYVEITGGNHEQMGWYTGQPNDPDPTISRDEQQRQLALVTATFLATLHAKTGG